MCERALLNVKYFKIFIGTGNIKNEIENIFKKLQPPSNYLKLRDKQSMNIIGESICNFLHMLLFIAILYVFNQKQV